MIFFLEDSTSILSSEAVYTLVLISILKYLHVGPYTGWDHVFVRGVHGTLILSNSSFTISMQMVMRNELEILLSMLIYIKHLIWQLCSAVDFLMRRVKYDNGNLSSLLFSTLFLRVLIDLNSNLVQLLLICFRFFELW